LSGQPTGSSNTTLLNVTVGGTGVVSYKFKVGVSGSTDCTNATGYSASIDVATKITSSISGLADGAVKLCVIGVDSAGNWQLESNATSTTWTKDTAAPTATLSGQPTGTSSTTTLNVTVGGTGVTSYKFKVGVSTSTDCANTTGYSGQTAVATKITSNISGLADGDVKLCVIGADDAGNWQTEASATSATWTKSGGGGGGTGSYVFMIPLWVDLGNVVVVKHVVNATGSDASGTSTTSTALGTQGASTDTLSLAMGSDDKAYVLYRSSVVGPRNKLAYRSVDSASLSIGSEVVIDNVGNSYTATSADIAIKESYPSGSLQRDILVYYSHNYFDATSRGARESLNGGNSTEVTEMIPEDSTPAVAPFPAEPKKIHLRVNSIGDREVSYVSESEVSGNISRMASRLYDDNTAGIQNFTDAHVICGANENLVSFRALPLSRGDDTAVVGACGNSPSTKKVSHNIARSAGGYSPQKSRVWNIPPSGITLTGSDPVDMVERGAGLDLFFIDGTSVKVCEGAHDASCDNGSGSTVFTDVGFTNGDFRAVTTSDGTVFVFYTEFDVGKVKVVRRLADGTWSAAHTVFSDNSNPAVVLGKRIGVVGVPANSNWAPRHTMFVSSLTHIGDMTGIDATTFVPFPGVSPDVLCRKYAVGARLPRANSTVALIGSTTESISTHVGTLAADVYSNESNPQLVKNKASFFNASDSNHPDTARYVTEGGASVETAPNTFNIWAGASGNAPGAESCNSGSAWSTGDTGSNGVPLTLGTGNWLFPSSGLTAIECSVDQRILCLTK
jgi:hypothetical protein